MFNSKLSPSATSALISSGLDIKSIYMERDDMTGCYLLYVVHLNGHRQVLRASSLEDLNTQVSLYTDPWLQYKEDK